MKPSDGINRRKKLYLSFVAVGFSALGILAYSEKYISPGLFKTLLYGALALFLAGILGNAYDRVFNNGMVRDFIDVYHKDLHWPAFNVADSMLCAAVGLLLLSTLLSELPGLKRDQRQK